jgi:hypothetical protein
MASKGFPEPWAESEYSSYFEKIFGDNRERQSAYLQKTLAEDRASLSVGLKHSGIPPAVEQLFEAARERGVRTSLDFLANPWNLWASERMEHKKAVLARPERFELPTPWFVGRWKLRGASPESFKFQQLAVVTPLHLAQLSTTEHY